MREAAGKTQVEVGAAPGSDQAEMSKLERRPDMMLSTLRRYAEALGARCEARTVRVTNTGAKLGLASSGPRHMLQYMKQILIEIDDRCARDLERVASAKNRQRSEFVRLAIRSALDRALDRYTEEAYRLQPLPEGWTARDTQGWDPANALATGPRSARLPRRKGTRVA